MAALLGPQESACSPAGLLVSWAAGCPQRSLEDEINRTTAQDLPTFAISYLVIFLYISLALGSYSGWRRVLVRGLSRVL